MKKTTNKIMIAAALLVAATGIASAQAMKADVPFAFRVGDTVMAAGTYRVEVNTSNKLVSLSSYETKQHIAILSSGGSDASKEWRTAGVPVLEFACGEGRCALTRLWDGADRTALSLPHRSLGPGQTALTLIRLVRASGE